VQWRLKIKDRKFRSWVKGFKFSTRWQNGCFSRYAEVCFNALQAAGWFCLWKTTLG